MLHRDTGERASFTPKEGSKAWTTQPSRTEMKPHEDHWETFAVAMELTIEGHRLIAEEIGFEAEIAVARGHVPVTRTDRDAAAAAVLSPGLS